jgi:clan AA aspartic protease
VTRWSVGEVRVNVKLTNAVDEELARQGRLSPDQVRTLETEALVDTGAAWTVLPRSVVTRLGLGSRGRRVATYADGRRDPVEFTGPVIIELLGRDTVEGALMLGDEVLIGQTVLEKADVLVDCRAQRVIPNPAHPDGPMFRI